MKRVAFQTLAVLLLCAGVVAAWLLRPMLEGTAQNVVPLLVEANCDGIQRSCRLLGDDIEFEIQLGPPVRSMETFAVVVRRVRGDIGADAQVDVQFQMRDMDMGLNRYRLAMDAEGVWRAQATLPVCSAGRSDWIAQVTITTNGNVWQALLPFVVDGR